MGILEQVMQMKNKGVSDEEIIGKLQEQRVSPKEINDAFNQSQIKNAVMSPQKYEQSTGEDYVPTNQESSEESQQDFYVPQHQEEYTQQQVYAPAQEIYQQNAYGGGYPQAEVVGTDSDTMIEIAEQVFSEKIKKIHEKIDEIDEFKTLAQTRIDDIVDRLKRIETIIDKLQITILEKISSYGRKLETTKKELDMVQESFEKIVPSMAERAEKIRKKTFKKR